MEATLQLIMEQLQELKTCMCAIDTGQEVLKSDITTTAAELKRHILGEVNSDKNNIRADLKLRCITWRTRWAILWA
jgi:hypothetical protein